MYIRIISYIVKRIVKRQKSKLKYINRQIAILLKRKSKAKIKLDTLRDLLKQIED